MALTNTLKNLKVKLDGLKKRDPAAPKSAPAKSKKTLLAAAALSTLAVLGAAAALAALRSPQTLMELAPGSPGGKQISEFAGKFAGLAKERGLEGVKPLMLHPEDRDAVSFFITALQEPGAEAPRPGRVRVLDFPGGKLYRAELGSSFDMSAIEKDGKILVESVSETVR